MLKISHAACPGVGLSLVISAQFALKMCLAAKKKSPKKSIKAAILVFKGIQGQCFRCKSTARVRLSIDD